MLYDKRWDKITIAESKTVRALMLARARIEIIGWSQNYGRDQDDNTCPLIAITEQFASLEFAAEPLRFFRKAINHRCIPEWNEAPGRTKDDVLRAFDLAIGLARADTLKVAA